MIRKQNLKPKSSKLRNKGIIVNGIQYKSLLEGAAATLLIEAGIPFQYEPITFVLQEGFKGENLCFEEDKFVTTNIGVKYTPDFVGDIWIMETKGMKTPDFSIKWKRFKQVLEEQGLEHFLFLPRNKKQIKNSIQMIQKLRVMQEAFAVVGGRIRYINNEIAEGRLEAEPIKENYAKLGQKGVLMGNWMTQEDKPMEEYEKLIIEFFNLENIMELEKRIVSKVIQEFKENTKIKYI